MPHFGDTLRRLREERGLTQSALALRAGVSNFTISKAEAASRCTWRRSTASDVFQALQKVAPLTESEAKGYLQMARLTHTLAAAESIAPALRDMPPGSEWQPLAPVIDAQVQTAHRYIDRLIDERGAGNVIRGLQGLAAAWDIDLPPEVTVEELKRPQAEVWTLISAPRRIEDREVQVYTPVVPQPAPGKSKKSGGEGRERKGA